MERRNKFVIISPSYNNEKWTETYYNSIVTQTYDNYQVVYINDKSTDNTKSVIDGLAKDNPKFKIIHHTENKGAAYNYIEYLPTLDLDPEDILVHLDGDDWLAYPTTLEHLNDFYNEKDVWMTYGKFITYPDLKEGNPQNTPYPDFVKNFKLYRRDVWRASHLRTYKYFLFNNIDKDDLKSTYTQDYFWHASDLAWAYPCLEMCPPEKIGVLDEVSYVYNISEADRTKERESQDNTKFEIEIRNKKVYKTLDSKTSTSKKLPQVNVWDYPQENNSLPTKFSYVYKQLKGEFDITLLNDINVLKYLSGEIPINSGKIIADLHESTEYSITQKKVYEEVKKNYLKFDKIVSYSKELEHLPNYQLRLPAYSVLNKNIHKKTWPKLGDPTLFKIYSKTKNISCISSNKGFLPGHLVRLNFVNHIQSTHPYVKLYGVGFNEIEGKIEGLEEYKYSIAIENALIPNWITEKVFDCFLTGTIPIYYGSSNIGEYFDLNGILTFNSTDELDQILDNLKTEGDKFYSQNTKAIKNNFEVAKQLWWDNDIFFDRYLKDLIDE